MEVTIIKNGMKKGAQAYKVQVSVRKGVTLQIHSNCNNRRMANTIKKNVETLLSEVNRTPIA